MKRIYSTAGWLVVAAALTIGMTACSDIADTLPKAAPEEGAGPKTYTMTIEASKGGDAATTRALSLDGKTISATWSDGDAVKVMTYEDPNADPDSQTGQAQGPTEYGTLTATSNGITTLLTGTVTGSITPGADLTLKYLNSNRYYRQDGTLNSIAMNCDYARADIKVKKIIADVDGKFSLIPVEGIINFESQQAIVCFTLNDEAGQPINVKQLNITVTRIINKVVEGNVIDLGQQSETYRIVPEAATSELYAAIPLAQSAKVMLEATLTDDYHRYYWKNGVTFENGKFYTVSVKLSSMGTVNLAEKTSDYTAQDGDVLYGTLPEGLKLSIAAGATVTLNGVTITGGEDESGNSWPGIDCKGKATINLGGVNRVNGFNEGAGIFIPSGYTLTIQGDGILEANGGVHCAGIGGNVNVNCGNIKIEGGNITATGGREAAGIGCGFEASCGNITISGGTVIATSGGGSAGIGSGENLVNEVSCGKITISGGTVTATGRSQGAGIGTGNSRNSLSNKCGTITISGGTVTATGSVGAAGSAGIGSGHISSCGDIKIEGGNITATGAGYAAGIGSGQRASCKDITISGGTVMATGGDGGAGIGSGNTNASCNNITISGGTVTATGGNNAAGIGSGNSNASCGTITIGSGISSVTAIKGDGVDYPIGKGKNLSTCGTVTIDGTTSWSAGTATENLYFNVSTTNTTDDTWTLTHK